LRAVKTFSSQEPGVWASHFEPTCAAAQDSQDGLSMDIPENGYLVWGIYRFVAYKHGRLFESSGNTAEA